MAEAKKTTVTNTKTKADLKTKIPPKKTKKSAEIDAPQLITRPPFLVLFALMAGIVLEWAFPTSAGGRVLGWIGFFMFAGALALLKWSFKTFTAAKTDISTSAPTTTIVTGGPYAYSRNPIYVSFLIGFIGLSFMADSVMMFLMVIPLFYTLALGVIIPEEEYLSEKFGADYTDYKKSTRRWL